MVQKQRIRLDEVTLMRCILAILIVFMHAFTCYDGSWHEPAGYVDVPLYKWLSRSSFAFTLEAFVFISGYLFAFQRVTLKRLGGAGNLILNKLKRLILPSIIFSAAYFFIFFQFKGWGDMIYSIVNGCGHMWYLPMLFWCFVAGWLLEQIRIGDVWKLMFLDAVNLLAIYTFPFQLTHACTFMFYFYGGFVVYKHRDHIKDAISEKKLVLGWIIFIILFAFLRPLRDHLVYSDDATKIYKLTMLVGDKLSQLLYASAGLFVFYCTAVFYTQKHKLSVFTVKLSSCCFGIYLFQQFILQLLYYKTTFPTLVGPYWLPWLGFIIAVVASYALSDLFLRTKTGKFLIG